MEELFRAHWPLVFRYFARRVRDRAIAEDLAADTFERAVRGFATWRGEAPAAWLLAIASNVLVDRTRRRRLETVPVDDDLASFADPEAGVDLARALSVLGDRDRRLLELLHVHRFTVAEVAAMTSATPAGVRTAAYRARETARRLLEDR